MRGLFRMAPPSVTLTDLSDSSNLTLFGNYVEPKAIDPMIIIIS